MIKYKFQITEMTYLIEQDIRNFGGIWDFILINCCINRKLRNYIDTYAND